MQVMVKELTTVLPDCPQLASNVMTALSSNHIQESIEAFLLVEVEGTNHGREPSCKPYAAAIHRALVSETISLLLTSILNFGSPTPAILSSLGMALITKQQQLPFIADRCDHPISSTSMPSVSLFQQECTPRSGVHLQDWRERLGAEIENQSYYQRDLVIRSVAQICHDLESRCLTVEEPLRREKEKSNRLEGEVDKLGRKLESIESKRWETREQLDALDSENERLEKERDEIADELERLRQDFDDANMKAEQTLREARDQHSTAEVQLRSTVLAREDDVRAREKDIQELHATVTAREEEVENLASTVQARENDVRAYEQEIRELKEGKDAVTNELDESRQAQKALNEQHNDLRAQLAEQIRALEIECEQTFALTGDINRLKTEESELAACLQDTKSELTNVTGRLEDLQTRHHELVQSSTEALENLERQFENEMDAAESKSAEERNHLNNSLQDALRSGREASETRKNLQQQLKELQTTVPLLKARIEELTNECLSQSEELDELRSWKNRVMVTLIPPEPILARIDGESQRSRRKNVLKKLR
jgi:septal ring factor EnvC (AmiA/AmiB activator)